MKKVMLFTMTGKDSGALIFLFSGRFLLDYANK